MFTNSTYTLDIQMEEYLKLLILKNRDTMHAHLIKEKIIHIDPDMKFTQCNNISVNNQPKYIKINI